MGAAVLLTPSCEVSDAPPREACPCTAFHHHEEPSVHWSSPHASEIHAPPLVDHVIGGIGSHHLCAASPSDHLYSLQGHFEVLDVPPGNCSLGNL